jgi:hypothetical protein
MRLPQGPERRLEAFGVEQIRGHMAHASRGPRLRDKSWTSARNGPPRHALAAGDACCANDECDNGQRFL